jgi:hypothetical protein
VAANALSEGCVVAGAPRAAAAGASGVVTSTAVAWLFPCCKAFPAAAATAAAGCWVFKAAAVGACFGADVRGRAWCPSTTACIGGLGAGWLKNTTPLLLLLPPPLLLLLLLLFVVAEFGGLAAKTTVWFACCT